MKLTKEVIFEEEKGIPGWLWLALGFILLEISFGVVFYLGIWSDWW